MNRRAWLLSATCALFGLALGAFLLWLLLPLAYPGWAGSGTAVEPARFSVADFNPAPATAWLSDSRGELDDVLKAQAGQDVLRLDVDFEAADYPQLALAMDVVPDQASVYLLWRTTGQPNVVHFAELAGAGRGESWHSPGASAHWSGSITEIALLAATLQGRPQIRLDALTFHPATREALVARSLSQWLGFEPWQMSSINRYPGARGDVILYPVAAFSAWTGIALVLFLALARLFRLPRRAKIATTMAVLFLSWLGLDLMWQSQLDRQLDATRTQFAGLTQVQKHMRDLDADLHRYADRLESILPDDPGLRIFLLRDGRAHNYRRLRLQFHMLPMNIHNFGSRLLPQMQPGDYVLLLDGVDGFRFDTHRHILSDGESSWRVRLVDHHRQGTLFRLERSVGTPTAAEAG